MKPLACVLLLFFAGCRSGTKPTLRIVTGGTTELFPVFLCQELGHFREEGLNVSIEALPGGGKLIESLFGGSAEMAVGGYGHVMQMVAAEKPLLSVFVVSLASNVVLVVSPAKLERIRRIEDLKGATVGVAGLGTPQHYILAYLLARQGLSIKDVMVVVHGAGASAVASIEHSKVDAGIVNGSALAALKRRTAAIRVLADPRTPGGLKEVFGVDSIATLCLFSTPQWIAANRDTVRRATRAMMKTHAWIRRHSADQIRERLPAQFRTSDSEVDVEILQSLMEGLSPDGRMPAGAPENARKVYAVSIGQLHNLDLSTTWTNEFVEAP